MTSHLPILEIRNLSKSYGAIRAVNDVSIHINRGEIAGLIGPNGSGKSTFFDCSSGLARPDSGTVILDGQDITGWSLNRIAREGRMLRSFQKTVTFKSLDVEENLIIAGQMFTFPTLASTFGLGKLSKSRIHGLRERARELIRMAGLWDVRHQPAGNLSGGQQKLIQFASGGADGRYQSEDYRARRRHDPLCQQVAGRQLPCHRTQYRCGDEHLSAGDCPRSGHEACRGGTTRHHSGPACQGGLSWWLTPISSSVTCVQATATSIF